LAEVTAEDALAPDVLGAPAPRRLIE